MRTLKGVLLFFLAVMITVSCDVLDKLDLTFTTGEQTVTFNAGPEKAGTHVFLEKVLVSDVEKEIEDQGGDVGKLKSVKVNSASVSIVSGAENLNAVESFEIWIIADGLDKVRIAWVDDIEDGINLVDLSLTDTDLKKYLELDEYTVGIGGVLSEDVDEEVELVAKITYDVEVGA